MLLSALIWFFSLIRPVYAHLSSHISQQQQRSFHLVQTVSCGSEVSCQSSAHTGRWGGLGGEDSLFLHKDIKNHLLLNWESVICHSLLFFFSIGGVAIVSISSMDYDKGVTGNHKHSEVSVRLRYCLFLNLTDFWANTGSLWSLVGAMLYAIYIVMIKRWVDREDKLDIPMFFGEETISEYVLYKCEAVILLIKTFVLVCSYMLVLKVGGPMTDRRFLLCRVCGPVQPSVAVARLPPAPLHRLWGLWASQPDGVDIHPH